MKKKASLIRVGVVGAGLMGHWHAKTIKQVGGSLVAVADYDLAQAQSLAANYRGAKSFTSLAQMISQVELDVLHICTSTASHYELAKLVIEAGLNLIIEKPIAPTAIDTEFLYDYAAKHGVLLCPVHQFIFQDGALKAKEWLPRIGRLVHLRGVVRSAGGTGIAGQKLNQIAEDILPHPLSIMQAILPAGLPGQDWITVRPGDGELYTVCHLPGLFLSIEISMNSRPTLNAFQLIGTHGTIHLDLFHGFAFLLPGHISKTRKLIYPFELAIRSFSAAAANLGRRIIHWEPAYPGLRRLIKSFYKAMQEETPLPILPEDAIAIARTRDRLLNQNVQRMAVLKN